MSESDPGPRCGLHYEYSDAVCIRARDHDLGDDSDPHRAADGTTWVHHEHLRHVDAAGVEWDAWDEPAPGGCPVCGSGFPLPATAGRITCTNGHVTTARDVIEAIEAMSRAMSRPGVTAHLLGAGGVTTTKFVPIPGLPGREKWTNAQPITMTVGDVLDFGGQVSLRLVADPMPRLINLGGGDIHHTDTPNEPL